MDIKYYPGCTIKTSAQNYETSAMAALKWLSVELNEIEDWNCCGVVHTLTRDDLMKKVAPLRVLMHVQHEEQRNEVVTLCDMCYNTLAQANYQVKHDAEQLQTLNNFIDCEEPYDGSVEVVHLLQVLRDDIGFDRIKKKVRNPLHGIKIFPYYGCMLLRPGEVGIDNAEDPTVLGDLARALGAEVIDDPSKVECCGSHHTVSNRQLVFDRVEKIVDRAKAKGADAIMLSCPLCRFNFDTRQQEHPEIDNPLPVFYYTQLMCIAFGLDEEVLGLDDHRVDPRVLLREIGNRRILI